MQPVSNNYVIIYKNHFEYFFTFEKKTQLNTEKWFSLKIKNEKHFG